GRRRSAWRAAVAGVRASTSERKCAPARSQPPSHVERSPGDDAECRRVRVTDETLMRWVIAWLPMLAILLFSASRKSASAGLVFAYALQLVILHWFAAVIYLLPWYSNLDVNVVFAGLQQSTYAFSGFTLGSVAISPLLMRRRDAESDPSGAVLADRGLIRTCLGMGIVSYFVLTPIVGTTPTVSAIVAAAASGVVVGLSLGCWNGSHTRSGATLWMWGA